MRRILCILICLCTASTASALSITNGDFENQSGSTFYDVSYWWDYGGVPTTNPPLTIDQGPYFYGGGAASFNGTKLVFMGKEANTNEDGGNHTYVYQSLGYYDGTPLAVDIALDWALAYNKTAGDMGVTVMILESDGTFEPNQWSGADHDIFGFVKTDEDPENPITEIGRGSVLRYAAQASPVTKLGVPMHERFQIDLRSATIGRELFLRFNNFRKDGGVVPYTQVDNITMSTAYIVNQLPEDGAEYILTERTSATNDLVFDVLDDSIIAVDIFFGPQNDPNLSAIPAYKIVDDMPIPSAGQYTVTLESLPLDLAYSKEYFWKVLAYESNGMGGLQLKYTGHITSFTTIQEGPFLEEVTPNVQGVWPGEDAVFRVPFHLKADTFQWFKEGNPSPLVNGALYSGVDSNSLTVLDVQLADEGTYYCVGTETASGKFSETLAPGVLFVKELKAYYPFETAGVNILTPDTKGGKNMQLMGGASVIVNAGDPNTLFGGYLKLNNPRGGTSEQYAAIADSSVAHFPEVTISCWVKPTILDLDYERYARVFDFGQDSSNYFYLTMLEHSNTASCHMTEDDPDDQHVEGIGEIGYGAKWVYVVLTIQEELNEETEDDLEDTFFNGRLYINGKFGGEDGVHSPSSLPKPLNYIGRAVYVPSTGAYPYFNGLIDDLKIYNYAKTAEEIAREYMDVVTDVDFICNMESSDLEDLDYDGDCQVSLSDLSMFAEKWLLNYFIYPD